MQVHRVTRERACEIVLEHVDTDKRLAVVARNAVEESWLDEELEECGADVDLLTRGTWQDEIIEGLEAGRAYYADENPPDVVIVIVDAPTVVRTIPVA
jgi:hypothetical protein